MMIDRLRSWRPLFQRFLPHRRRMGLGAGLGLLTLLAGIGLLSLAGWFLTAAAMAGLTAAGGAAFNFFFPSIGVRLFAFTRTLSRYGERIFSHDATFRILESLRVWFYRQMEPLAPGILAKYRSGDILNRLVEDIDTLDNLYLRFFSPAVSALLITIGLTTLLWFMDPVLAVFGLGFMAAGGLVVPLLLANLGSDMGGELSQRSTDLRNRMVEGIQGLPEILAYGAVETYMENINRDNRALLKVQYRMSRLTGLSGALTTLISGLAVTVTAYIGIGLTTRGLLDGATLAFVMLAVMASYEAILPLPMAFRYLGRTQEAGDRVLEFSGLKPAVSFPARSTIIPEPSGLCFENVSFRYDLNAHPALDRINFQVDHGCKMAVIGRSGSGKSTLARLATRFWDPDDGRIIIGGKEIGNFSEADLRKRVSMVSQSAHIFHASIRDNLLMAKPDATEDELNGSLSRVKLLDWVQGLPSGLDTWLGEAGRLISGGQARRLALARAFLHDAPIWILDEPTEGLDRTTARDLADTIFRRTRGKTLIWITHRLTEMDRMDHVLLLESGRIAAEGSHNTLLAQSAAYRDCSGTL